MLETASTKRRENKVTRVIILVNRDKPGAVGLAKKAEQELAALGADVDMSVDREDCLTRSHYDLAVVFGGDGTVLGAVSMLGRYTPEIVAFNLGHLGYLAENSPDALSEVLRAAVAGTLAASRRMLVEAEVESPDGKRGKEYALNEFVLSQRLSGRLLPVAIRVDGEELMQFRGDGIIVGTPTGSTAYSLSAGGPVASPEMDAIIVTPLCPHQLANRSLILNPAEVVGVEHYADQPVALMADGRFCFDLEKGETLTVRTAPRRVTFLSMPKGRYKLLREKLGWGWQNQAFQ